MKTCKHIGCVGIPEHYGGQLCRRHHSDPRAEPATYRDARLPLQPLVDAADVSSSTRSIAATFGVHKTTARRWLEAGLTLLEADRAAIAVGTHPAVVWGSLWWEMEVAA